MTEINPKLNSTQAGQIAKNLDKKDGKEDGKISASIWNEFVADKGGKEIKNFITTENAMNSITTYLIRNANKLNETVNDLADSWLNKEVTPNDSNKPTPPVDAREDSNSKSHKQAVVEYYQTNESGAPTRPILDRPQKDLNPPGDNPFEMMANKNVKVEGGTIEYNEKGCVSNVKDDKGRYTRLVQYDKNGTLEHYVDFEYDDKDNVTKVVYRHPDGSVRDYSYVEYDENNKETKRIHENMSNNKLTVIEIEHNTEGAKTNKTTIFEGEYVEIWR